MRFREDTLEEQQRARDAVVEWCEQHPDGTADQLVEAIGDQFHREYGPVLRAALFVVDRDRDRARGK